MNVYRLSRFRLPGIVLLTWFQVAVATLAGDIKLQAESITYALTTFDAPGSVFGTHATGINNQDYIVGYYEDAQRNGQGFIRDPAGKLSPIAVPGATATLPEGINDYGVISGLYYTSAGSFGFVRDAQGNYTSFSVPGESRPATEGFGINNNGEIVVYSQAPGGSSWVRSPDGTTYAETRILGANFTVGIGINDSGETVGGAIGGSFLETTPYLMEVDHVHYSLLSVPGATQGATANDINNQGDIVGIGFSTNSHIPFARYADGTYNVIGIPGEVFQELNGVNDQGWIVGWLCF